MKNIFFVLLMTMFSQTSFAQESFLAPSLHFGVGSEHVVGFNTGTYGTVLAKGMLLKLGDDDLGVKLLGVGVSLNSRNDTSLLIPVMSFYYKKVSIGPDLLLRSRSVTNFGFSISYEF